MIKKESVLHTTQNVGLYYSIDGLKGYYNDLRGKVINTRNIDESGIPYNIAAFGEKKKTAYFPIAIFQYGLGAYDLWIESNEKKYFEMMLKMADWAVENQDKDGSWNTFGVLEYSNPYSSMAQGEGASLCARAYVETNDTKYYKCCVDAIEFMLRDINDGGTTDYQDGKMILLEYPEKAVVLNGWIFSGFGLLDCWKITKNEEVLKAWNKTIEQIENMLPEFDANIWSYYDCNGKYTSPFYHELHIALLKVCYDLTKSETMLKYANKWKEKKDSFIFSKMAFVIKAWQKVTEKRSCEWFFVE